MNAQDKIYALFQDGTLAKKTETEICKILQLPFREKGRLVDVLNQLCLQGKIYQNRSGRYGTIQQLGLIKGTLSGNERGFAFLTPEDKQRYEEHYGITHSKCYTEYGLKRTGCAGCPFGKRFEAELEVIQKYEPKLYKAVMNIFGDSYAYTRAYKKFCEEMKAKEKQQ